MGVAPPSQERGRVHHRPPARLRQSAPEQPTDSNHRLPARAGLQSENGADQDTHQLLPQVIAQQQPNTAFRQQERLEGLNHFIPGMHSPFGMFLSGVKGQEDGAAERFQIQGQRRRHHVGVAFYVEGERPSGCDQRVNSWQCGGSPLHFRILNIVLSCEDSLLAVNKGAKDDVSTRLP
ncbi:hypothetical protein DEDE109153_16470 [Deinococcus deserti]